MHTNIESGSGNCYMENLKEIKDAQKNMGDKIVTIEKQIISLEQQQVNNNSLVSRNLNAIDRLNDTMTKTAIAIEVMGTNIAKTNEDMTELKDEFKELKESNTLSISQMIKDNFLKLILGIGVGGYLIYNVL